MPESRNDEKGVDCFGDSLNRLAMTGEQIYHYLSIAKYPTIYPHITHIFDIIPTNNPHCFGIIKNLL